MIVWWNGVFCPVESVKISPLDRGFLYGDGLFETIRLQDGVPLRLSEHLDRLKRGLYYFKLGKIINFFEYDRVVEIISGLYRANPFRENVARLKIVVTRGKDPSIGLPEVELEDVTIIFTITPYTPPSDEEYQRGWRVTVIPGCYSPPLGAHKTLNYLFYLWTKEYSLRKGFREAVFEDTEGRIVETSTASIAVFVDGVWVFPFSPWKLRGVTERVVEELLIKSGASVASREISRSEIMRAHTLWLMNSLMGVMPVSEIDGRVMPDTMSEYAMEFRKRLFSNSP